MPRLALLLTTFIWGATFPATKAALEQIPPLSFLGLRFLLGTLLIGAWFLMAGYRLRRERAVLAASAVATVFLFFGYALQTVGLSYTSASNSAFLTALYVIIVPLMLRRFDRSRIDRDSDRHGGALVPRQTQYDHESRRRDDDRLCRRVCRTYRLFGALHAAIRRAEFAPVADGRDDVAVSSAHGLGAGSRASLCAVGRAAHRLWR